MRKQFFGLLASITGAAFIVIVIGSYVIAAQTPITGEWRSESREKDGKLHLSFEREVGKSHNQFSSTFDYSDLQGLSAEQTRNGKVSFRIVREAGIAECEGTFVDGKGSGTFRFTPDPNFPGAMKSRGFDFEKAASSRDGGLEEKLFSAAMLNVTTALAADLKSVDLGPLDVEDLFKAAIFHVDSKFMAEMKASGFPGLKMEDLVKARIFKIDADYVRQINEMGFADKDFENLVKFRIFKVTAEFLGELKELGFTNISSEEVVKCRIFNIDGDFIKKAKASDPNVTIEDLVRMRIGVHRGKVTD